jgi:2-aminobenzoate-CoA ligase
MMAGQVDRYVHELLPRRDQWPELLLSPDDAASRPLNCVTSLLDRHADSDRPALLSDTVSWSYAELYRRVSAMAHVLTRDYGIVSGNRVLVRGPNSPMLAALWLAIQKVGAIAVTTMSLLRSRELAAIIAKAKPQLAICDLELAGELRQALESEHGHCALLTYDAGTGELERRMSRWPDHFDSYGTLSDDISLIGFTSGTTGGPKATIHFHRDILSVCAAVADHIVKPCPEDVFISTSPLAFTFGLGGLVLFPLYAGSSAVLNARYTPESLLASIGGTRASICFTVPTFYQQMARICGAADTRSLRLSVSSGEMLPQPVRTAWEKATGLSMTEILGSTEMLHAFIGATGEEVRPGFIGRAIAGYRVAVLDEGGQPLPAGEIGRLAVQGPTGCRYLDDPRQEDYVQQGWNITGDACLMDDDGYVAYHTRLDDMIISAGYNISGTEVENVLLDHPRVAECAVIGTSDGERGQVVTAYVVPGSPVAAETEFVAELQSFARDRMAPYKYPRKIYLLDKLPRNESGKIQRFRLRDSVNYPN